MRPKAPLSMASRATGRFSMEMISRLFVITRKSVRIPGSPSSLGEKSPRVVNTFHSRDRRGKRSVSVLGDLCAETAVAPAPGLERSQHQLSGADRRDTDRLVHYLG